MDNIEKIITTPCPICGSESGKHLFTTRDYKQAVTDDLFGVRRCRNCGAGYLSPRPNKTELTRYYNEHFYWSYENDVSAKEDIAKFLALRRPQLEAKARWLAHLAPGRLLDIGTMKGEFIHHMGNLGWQAEGVELSTLPPNLFNMNIRYGDFLAMDIPEETYDCITMWAVLEHVYEPSEFVAKVARLLKPGGRFVFLVTNFNSIQGRIFEMDDFPRHLNLFTKNSAQALLQRHGLEVVRQKTEQSVFGGPLQGALIYLSKRLGGYRHAEIMQEWKNDRNSKPFFVQWHGHEYWLMWQIYRIDRLLLAPLEALLDRLGMGFILTIEACKPLPPGQGDRT